MRVESRRIRIAHLYPEQMNLYGDRGNILSLVNRCEWRGIGAEVTGVGPGLAEPLEEHDLIFFGGGQDRDQARLLEDLLRVKGPSLERAISGGSVVLAVCGGFQMLGTHYRTAQGELLQGLGLFDLHTEPGTIRAIGNVALEVPGLDPMTVVGFENHSGRTVLGPGLEPLGRVLHGVGNNGEDGTEGLRAGRVFATYVHGSLLPKNPHLADLLVGLALEHAGYPPELARLPDEEEWAAHRVALSLAGSERRVRQVRPVRR